MATPMTAPMTAALLEVSITSDFIFKAVLIGELTPNWRNDLTNDATWASGRRMPSTSVIPLVTMRIRILRPRFPSGNPPSKPPMRAPTATTAKPAMPKYLPGNFFSLMSCCLSFATSTLKKFHPLPLKPSPMVCNKSHVWFKIFIAVVGLPR